VPVYDAHKNFSYSTVAVAPSPATSGLSLTVAAGTGTLFPTPPFNCVIWPTGVQPTAANSEIVRVSNIVGDVFTIARIQELTSARTVVVGDQIAVAITAKLFADLETGYASSITFAADESVKRITITDANVTTTSKITHSIRRADITDVADPGWMYTANVVTQTNGTFDILVVAHDLDGPTLSAPNESVTIHYHLWS
jgi:hypothetical protein